MYTQWPLRSVRKKLALKVALKWKNIYIENIKSCITDG